MERNWKKVYESDNNVKVELAHQILDEEGIESVILNKKDSAYGFGESELYVDRDNVLRAKIILKEL